MTRRARPRLLRLVLTAGLAVALVGCGDQEDPPDQETQESSTEAWAQDLCGDVGSWADQLDESRQALADPRELSVDVVDQAIDQVREATGTLVTQLQDLEAPDTEAGDEAAQRVSALTDELEAQSVVIEEAAGQEPQGVQGRLARVSTVTGAASTMLTEASSTVEDLRTLDGADEVRAAVADADSCQELSG